MHRVLCAMLRLTVRRLVAGLAALPLLAAAGPLAFITNQGSDSVSVVDVATARVVKEIAVGKAPAGIAVSAAAGRAYVTNPGDHSVSVIDLASLRLLRTLGPSAHEPEGASRFGRGSVGLAVSPNGRFVYLSDWFGGRLNLLDAFTLEPLTDVAVGVAPAGVTVSPDGRTVWVAVRDDDVVQALDAITLTPRARIAVGTHPFAVGVSPDGRWLLALNVVSHDVSVIDAARSAVIATLPVGQAPYDVTFTADSARAFVTNQHGGTVSVIDLPAAGAPRVAATWAAGEYPEGIALAGDTLLVVSWMDDAVHLLDARTGQRRASVDVGRNPRGFGAMLWAGPPASSAPTPKPIPKPIPPVAPVRE
jgi:YVTN family beta-propeller protein